MSNFSQPSRFTLRAPAKINLFLYVTGMRPNGYHELRSCFLPLTFYDELDFDFAAQPGVELVCSDPALSGTDNLAAKAVTLYCASRSIAPSCRIRLEKRIFTAAGLGGGSSDAAAALRACAAFYGGATRKELAELAKKLGADVPFFLEPQPSLAAGIGDELAPVVLQKRPAVLLVNPRFPVDTRKAYRACCCVEAPPLPADWIAHPERCTGNSLAAPLFHKFPLLRLLRAALRNTGAEAVEITGSGPTLFALFETTERARAAETVLRRGYGDAILTQVAEVLP